MTSGSEADAAHGAADIGDAKFRALLQAAVDAIIMIDERGCVLHFNPAAERMFGYSEQEMLGCNINRLMPEPHATCHDGYIEHYLTTGERRIIGIGRELQGKRRNGETFPMELSVGQVDLSGPPRFVGIIRDISSRKRAEQETRELQERLARVGRFSTMGEMAAGLAHEINQPLAAINTYAQTAERMVAQGDPPDLDNLKDICRKISEQAHRAGEVIQRLRGFLRTQDSWRERLDCNALIREIMLLAELDARDRDVPLFSALARELPPVRGNPVEIQQVMLNLVRNAVDAMADQPDRSRGVIITTANCDDEGVEVVVTDHGPGVAEEIAGQIFHPFVTSKADGLGVGLSISRTIVQSHGGRLSFDQNPAGGAIFSFFLPASFED